MVPCPQLMWIRRLSPGKFKQCLAIGQQCFYIVRLCMLIYRVFRNTEVNFEEALNNSFRSYAPIRLPEQIADLLQNIGNTPAHGASEFRYCSCHNCKQTVYRRLC